MRKGSTSLIVFMFIGAGFLLFCCFCGVFSLGLNFASEIAEWIGIDAPFTPQEGYEFDLDWEDEYSNPTPSTELDEQEEEDNEHNSLHGSEAEEEEPAAPVQPSEPVTEEELNAAYETLSLLEEALVPLADAEDIAFRLLGIDNIPEFIDGPIEYQIGDSKTFWLSNLDSNESFQQECELAYITDHAYFWIEPGVNYR
jgi:hypothetical protein